MADSLIVDIGGQRLVPCLLLDLKPQHSKKVSKRLPGFVPKLEIGIKHVQLVKAMARLRSPCFRMSQIKKLVFLHPRPPEEAHRLRPQPGQQLILYRSGTRRDSDRTTGGHSPCLSRMGTMSGLKDFIDSSSRNAAAHQQGKRCAPSNYKRPPTSNPKPTAHVTGQCSRPAAVKPASM